MTDNEKEKTWCNFGTDCPACRSEVFVDDDCETLADGRADKGTEVRCLNCGLTGVVVLQVNAGSTVNWNGNE